MTGTVLISQNAPQNGFKKCKVTLSISEMARDYAKANNLNMSSVLENALKSGDFNIKKGLSYKNPSIRGFISEKVAILNDFSSNVEPSCLSGFVRAVDNRVSSEVFQTNRNSNKFDSFEYDLVNAKKNKIILQNSENFVINDSFINYIDEVFTMIMTKTQETLVRMGISPEILTIITEEVRQSLNVGMLPAANYVENLSIAEFFARHELEFRAYAADDVKTEKVLDYYCNYLAQCYGICKPSDLTTYKAIHGKNLNSNQKHALAKLFKFMKFAKNMESFNGIDLGRFTDYLNAAKITTQSKQTGRQRRISNEALKTCFEQISHKKETEFVQRVGKLIYYSGCRFEQLIRVLTSKNKHIEIHGDFCVLDGSAAALGDHKKLLKLYFPVECYDFLMNFKIPKLNCQKGKPEPKHGPMWISRALDVRLESGELINCASLRKYNYNVLRVDLKINKDIADLLQSRVTADVGTEHYLDGESLCREAYGKAVKILRERLPWE